MFYRHINQYCFMFYAHYLMIKTFLNGQSVPSPLCKIQKTVISYLPGLNLGYLIWPSIHGQSTINIKL